ncbi:MAG: hypothetical protein WCS87_16695 [Methylococcaceae bacterium]
MHLYRFSGHPEIKDPIEVFGVPHTEIELIIIKGEAVGLIISYKLTTVLSSTRLL